MRLCSGDMEGMEMGCTFQLKNAFGSYDQQVHIWTRVKSQGVETETSIT